jgi:hypothetical protein
MATTFERAAALNTLCNEQLGFRFGNPLRVSENSFTVVVPIVRETAAHRQYVTLPEAGSNVEIRDTGRIDRFEVKNHTEENVFIRFGTIFKGNTQERALLRSVVVFPGAKAEVEVRCVHASKGIRPGAKTAYSGYTSLDYDQRIYEGNFGTGRANQAHVWNTVEAVSAAMFGRSTCVSGTSAAEHYSRLYRHSRSPVSAAALRAPMASASIGALVADAVREKVAGAAQKKWGRDTVEQSELNDEVFPYSDDFAANMEAFSRSFEDVIHAVERQENQAGFALITPSGVETIETFDSPLSWKAIHEDAVKRVGTKLLDQSSLSVFEYKPERAKDAIRAVLSQPFKEKVIWEHRPNNGDPHVLITGLSADGYTGEVVEVDHRVIHLCLIKVQY